VHRSFLAIPALLLGGLLVPVAAMAQAPESVVESVYRDLPNTDEPPGGYAAWSGALAATWRGIYDHLAKTESKDQPVVFPGAGPAADGDLTITSDGPIEADSARVRAVYANAGYDPVVMIFTLQVEDGTWKISDAWREAPPGEERFLSELLDTLY
jgi:hypothetical protein